MHCPVAARTLLQTLYPVERRTCWATQRQRHHCSHAQYVDGMDGKKFEEILAFMDIRKIGIMVLQDTCCPQSNLKSGGLANKCGSGLAVRLNSLMWEALEHPVRHPDCFFL